MITVQILINGQVYYSRSAKNVSEVLKTTGVQSYLVDDGRILKHRRELGAVPLCKKMLDGIIKV